MAASQIPAAARPGETPVAITAGAANTTKRRADEGMRRQEFAEPVTDPEQWPAARIPPKTTEVFETRCDAAHSHAEIFIIEFPRPPCVDAAISLTPNR